MKISFVGKGGSGKSTVSWLFANQLVQQDDRVLAIDADYNLDLLHNFHFTNDDVPNFLNVAEKDFYQYLQLSEQDYYIDIPNKKHLSHFSLSPLDWFSKKYSFLVEKSERIRLMVTGMVPDEMLYGHRCGHAYISSLKYYLPLLHCKDNEHVVVDSVAGTDLVSYGMFLGCDAVVVVVEETPHSVGVYEQIKHITDEFAIPTFVILNKFRDTGRISDFVTAHEEQIIGRIPFSDSILDYNFSKVSEEIVDELQTIREKLSHMKFNQSLQWERHIHWRTKYDAQLAESKQKEFQFLES